LGQFCNVKLWFRFIINYDKINILGEKKQSHLARSARIINLHLVRDMGKAIVGHFMIYLFIDEESNFVDVEIE
jgi:hypothetical protein